MAHDVDFGMKFWLKALDARPPIKRATRRLAEVVPF